MKSFIYIFTLFWSIACFSAVDCGSNNAACTLQLTSTGALIDMSTGKKIVQSVETQGMLADVSLLKFNDQYVLVRESLTNDKSTILVPIKMKNNSWVYDTAYNFSISLINSSTDTGIRWSAVKAKIPQHPIDNSVWDISYDETGKISVPIESLSHWLSPWIKVSTAPQKEKVDQCFIPFIDKESLLPVDLIACGAIGNKLTDGNYSFSGVVGPKAYVEMNLNIENSRIEGNYFYIKKRKKLLFMEK